MADQDTSAIKALNDLIATCRDAEEGYAKAAKSMHDNTLSHRLTEISGQRGQFADELSKLVSGLGGQSATDAHYGGILHSGWVDLETRIRPKDERDILQDCQRGDEGTLKHYAHALDQQLPKEARAVVERQRSAIQNDLNTLETRISHGKSQHA
ncbi:MAG: PA2169 family four-helix-bundle protein [Acidobacteriaceae bacterium]|nr:PA2169 family four-helix-bundle protein [Acidobacteriaceae bacterium]